MQIIRNLIQSGRETSIGRIMVVIITTAAFLLTVPPSKAKSSEEELAPLWQRATAHMRRQIWVPGEVETHEMAYDQQGGLAREEKVVLNLLPAKDGNVQVRLISATEDGKEITAKVRSQVEGTTTLHEVMGASPFAPAKGQQVTARPSGERRQIAGHPCNGYRFSFHTGDATFEGIAWLDRSSGLPLEARAEMISLPFREDGVTITAYSESRHYRITAQGHCQIKRALVKMTLQIPGFQGRVDAIHRFKHHWKWVPKVH